MNAPTPPTPPKPVTEAALRKRLAKHRKAMATKGLYPVVVKAIIVLDGLKLVEIPGDAVHPTLDPLLVGDYSETPVKVRMRRATLWDGTTVKAGELITVPLSQVTWLD